MTASTVSQGCFSRLAVQELSYRARGCKAQAYSLEIFPAWNENQPTLAPPGFHSSLRNATVSCSVMPGGRRRRTTFWPSTGVLPLPALDDVPAPAWGCDFAWDAGSTPLAVLEPACELAIVSLVAGDALGAGTFYIQSLPAPSPDLPMVRVGQRALSLFRVRLRGRDWPLFGVNLGYVPGKVKCAAR